MESKVAEDYSSKNKSNSAAQDSNFGLRNYISPLKWVFLDHSSLWRAGLSWSIFFVLNICVPIASHFLFSCSDCDPAHQRPYDAIVQLSLSSFAAVSFFGLSSFARTHRFRKFLFLYKLGDESDKIQQGYVQQFNRSMKLLLAFVLPCFVADSVYKIWWFSTVGTQIPYLYNIYLSKVVVCILLMCSWLYRTSICYLVCILFRLTCYLQLLKLQNYAQVFERESNVSSILTRHLRIRRNLRVISHRFRRFILFTLITVTMSQFISLLVTTEPSSKIDVYIAGELALCSITLVTGLFICLCSAAKITNKAHAITALAAKWHACSTMSSFDDMNDETPRAHIASIQPVYPVTLDWDWDTDKEGGDDDDEQDNTVPNHASTISYQKRQALEKGSRWEGRIRDLAHEAENFIEYFISLRIQTLNEGIALPDLEDQLKNVTEKLGLIAGQVMEERPAYLPPSSSSSPSRHAANANDTVIGLADDVTRIIRDRLCGEPSSNLHVIPIVGMGGIGKTTLATTVYNHASILQHFDFRAWITVSQDYSTHSLRKILIGLLESMNLLEELVSGQKIDGSDDVDVVVDVDVDVDVDVEGREDLYKKLEKVDVSEMEIKVFQNLKYRRYLIVMDDVWTTEVWDDLMKLFPDDGCGSRIMVTTRLLNLAAYIDSNSPLHEMQAMNVAQSWKLLKQKVFTNGDCPPHLKGIGEEIAKSCAGLPLTVVLVAGILSTVNNTQASWEEIAKDVNSIAGKELEGILSLSYTNLPLHLRPCFLYFGGFPEDEKIRVATLIKLWVAEGFLKYENKSDKSLEEEAEEYLDDLVKRNLVIVTSRKSDGRMKSCSLHDMIRDLCIRKVEEGKFLRVMDGRVVDSRETIDEQRISLVLSDMDSCFWAPTTRTIMIFNPKDVSKLQVILGRFKLLRVFHHASAVRVMLSPRAFQLFYLRYLTLNGSLEITSAISNLVNLQTLILLPPYHYRRKRRWTHDQRFRSEFSLPLEIWRMPQLRHLVLYNLFILPHPPEGTNLPLVNLQTLSLIINLVWSEKMVEMIPNVKTLGLVYMLNKEFHLHHLKYLFQLEKLQVHGYGNFIWLGQYPSFLRTLKKLSLVGGGFPWENMAIIGSLPNLQVLKLRDYACHGERWETGDDEFPRLKYLLIETSCIQQWITASSSFPILERLVLHSCGNLEKIPEEIGEIWTLELIEVRNCRMSVVESANHIKEFKLTEEDDDAFQVRFTFTLPSPQLFPPQLREEQNEQPSIEVGIRYIDELETEEEAGITLDVETGIGYSDDEKRCTTRQGYFLFFSVFLFLIFLFYLLVK